MSNTPEHEPAAPAAAPAPDLPSGRFSGRIDFQERVRAALQCAARDGWRELILCDADFADWPLGEREVAETLHAWAQPGRRCTLIARRFDEVVRRHARFVSWRQTWSHLVECRVCPSADPLELPSALWSPVWVMQRIEPERSIGLCGPEPERRLLLRESLQEWLGKSTPGFASSTLGL